MLFRFPFQCCVVSFCACLMLQCSGVSVCQCGITAVFWCFGVPWTFCLGVLVFRCLGVLGSGYPGVLVPWGPSVLVSRCLSVMGSWCPMKTINTRARQPFPSFFHPSNTTAPSGRYSFSSGLSFSLSQTPPFTTLGFSLPKEASKWTPSDIA